MPNGTGKTQIIASRKPKKIIIIKSRKQEAIQYEVDTCVVMTVNPSALLGSYGSGQSANRSARQRAGIFVAREIPCQSLIQVY